MGKYCNASGADEYYSQNNFKRLMSLLMCSKLNDLKVFRPFRAIALPKHGILAYANLPITIIFSTRIAV